MEIIIKILTIFNFKTFCTLGDEPPLSNSGPPELISANEFRPALSTHECLIENIYYITYT